MHKTENENIAAIIVMLKRLQNRGFEGAALLREKFEALAAISGAHYAEKIGKKLEETIRFADRGQPEATLHLMALAEFVDNAIVEKTQYAKELGLLLQNLWEPKAAHAQASAVVSTMASVEASASISISSPISPSNTEEPRPKKTTLLYGKSPLE
ncbi:MAG: hypothetical protein FWG75_08275 [Cystobacterineae bacterium]|nr:hypothetical protein [Cystobacterineae bacterium]